MPNKYISGNMNWWLKTAYARHGCGSPLLKKC